MKAPYLIVACLLIAFIGRGLALEYFCSDQCVMDISLMTAASNDGTTCSFSCPGGGGSMTSPCTSTTSTTTTTTTTTTPAPPVIDGPCASINKTDGFYDNKCVIVDVNANCNEVSGVCECSEGFSGSTCGIAAKQLEAIEKLLGGGPEAVEQAQKLLKEIAESKGSGGAATLISNLPSLLSFLTDEKRVSMSYSVNEVIMGATYEGKALNPNTDFTRVSDPSLGNCFTFNHHNASSKYKIRRVGDGAGLRVELDSIPEEYAPWTDLVGMGVYVHPIGQELNVESLKYASIAGSADQIVLKRSTSHKVGKKCARSTSAAQSFYMPGYYSVDGCLRACYQDEVYRRCGCMDASYARKAGVDGCGFTKQSCIASVAVDRGDPVSWKECRCPQPCDEETFDFTVSRAMHSRVDNASLTQRRSQITLYFDSFETRVSREVYKVSLSQFIGNVGGVAGLLLGITFSFLIEVILLAIFLFSKGCCGSTGPEVKKNA